VLEAALGVKQLRETEMLDDQAAFDVTVEVITRTAHQMPAKKCALGSQMRERSTCGDEGEAALNSNVLSQVNALLKPTLPPSD